MKELIEKRATLKAELDAMLETAKTEKRAMTEEETTAFDAKEKEIKNIDDTIAREKRAKDIAIVKAEEEKEDRAEETKEEVETRAFESIIRGIVETRTDSATNFTAGDNGAVIPTSIANKIISKVVDICPIYSMADRYNVGGTLSIPYYDESTQAITMSYADEFTTATSTAGKFTSITLTGYLARALSKVSINLINNSAFDIVSYVIDKMAEAINKFIEKELLVGTSGKVQGLVNGVTQVVTSASATAITADELMDTQDKVPDVYQQEAVWIMNKVTRTAIRKLKDGDGNYLLNKDFNSKWGYTLLGKDVYCSDNVDSIASGKIVAFYGDLTGLAVKVTEEMNIQVLREKYADEHCVGVLAFVNIDAKVENAQKLSALKCKTTA